MADPFSPEPFRIDVPQETIDDLQNRLCNTRWPDQLPGTTWEYGADITALRKLCRHWSETFDWRQSESLLNAWPQFTVNIDGQRIHYAHIRSTHSNAMPLVLTHGWPGSIAEFLKIVGPLTDPAAHGGDPDDAFHVVVPSIPGYGFSGPTTDRGWDVARVARATATLMAGLGYDRYVAQGGDWGSVISSHIGVLDAGHVAGIHINMVVARPPTGGSPLDGVLPEEMAGLAYMANFRGHETGYQEIQKTRPQTLAYGLTDSPAGLAGWILEKFRQWSDCDGDPFNTFTLDELCTNIMIYWVTGTINSSTRLYYESLGPDRATPLPRVNVPTGCALFPKELYQAPRVWADAQYNVQHWSRFAHGGHFAAMEQPVELVNDIRAFVRTLRS